MQKTSAYICSALTELPPSMRDGFKVFLSRIADVCAESQATGYRRAFVPHEKFDPVRFANIEDVQVYKAESKQIRSNTCLLIVVYQEPSWGGGAEIALACQERIPVLFLVPQSKRISRYISGMVKEKGMLCDALQFVDYDDALDQLRAYLAVGSFVPSEPDGASVNHP